MIQVGPVRYSHLVRYPHEAGKANKMSDWNL
jgi:hypothetical protein